MRRLLLAALLFVPSAAAHQPKAGEGLVVLPVEHYRALRDKAYPPEPERPLPPVDAALTRVEYDLRVEGESASGEARLAVDVFKEGWVRVAVPDGLLVSAARVDGRPVALVDGAAAERQGGDASRLAVLLSRRGAATIALDVVVPVSAAAGIESLTLPPSPSVLARASLTLPRRGLDLVVRGGLLMESSEAESVSRYVAQARSGATLSFSWRRKTEERRETLPLRLRGAVTAFVGLGEDSAQVNAEIGLSIAQGAASAVGVALPEGFAVNEVSGALVSDWNVAGATLQVRFLEPVERETTFVVQGERRAAREGALEVPLLRLPGAERETGGVAVEVLGAGEITASRPRGLETADPSDLGGPVAGRDAPSLVAFRYRAQDGAAVRGLAVEVARYTPQAVLVANVEEARLRVLISEEGKRLVWAGYAVRSSQRSFLALALPQGATLWSASVDGRPVRPGRAPDGALLLPLPKTRAGERPPVSAIEIAYVERVDAWAAQGRMALEFPAPDLPVSRTGLELHYPPRYKVSAESGSLRTAEFQEADAVFARAELDAPSGGKARANEAREQLGADLEGLLDRYQKADLGRRAAGTLPLRVRFRPYGPRLFLAGELSAEKTAPRLDLVYKRSAR